MESGRNFDYCRPPPPRRHTIHPDFGAAWIRLHLSPSDMPIFPVKFRIYLGLPVLAYLDGAGICVISVKTQHQVVLARRKRQHNRRLTGLLIAIDEDVGSGGSRGHEQALRKRLELNSLV